MVVTKVKKEMVDGLQAAIDVAVGEALGFDISDYYTKTEADASLTDYATTAAMNAALSGKVDDAELTAAVAALSADIDAAVNVALPQAIELQKDFVASGAITAGQFVSLRVADGKVEAVTGTETAFSVGADNTSLTAANAFVLMDAVWHAATSKIAVFYLNDTATDDLQLVIGTVSGGTITFGSPVTIASGANYSSGLVAWNAAGTLIFSFYIGASGQGWVRGCSVSGSTLTLGGAANNVIGASINTRAIFLDESLGYVVCVASLNYGAAAYSGANVSAGLSTQTFTMTGQTSSKYFYDAANHRLVITAYNSTSLYAIAFVLAAGSVTNGTEVSQASAVLLDARMASDGKVLAVCMSSTSTSIVSGYVLTFATAATTINAGVNFGVPATTTGPILGGRVNVVYNSTLNKFIIGMNVTPAGVTNVVGNVYLTVATISGTSFSFTAFSLIYSRGFPAGRIWQLFSNAAGTEVALLVVDETDGGRPHIITAKSASGAWAVTHDVRIKSAMPNLGAVNGSARFVQGDWNIWDLGNWSATTGTSGFTSTTLTVSHITLPTEATNADAWIGQARETVADGATVRVMLRGGLASGLSGMTVGDVEYLKGDGTNTTTDNGRRLGKAVSAAELLMEAA